MSHGKKIAEVPLAVREISIKKWKEGLNCRQIEQDLFTNYSTVSRIIKRYKDTNSIQNKKGRGRKPILSAREKRILLREVRSNCRVSACELKYNVKEYFAKIVLHKKLEMQFISKNFMFELHEINHFLVGEKK